MNATAEIAHETHGFHDRAAYPHLDSQWGQWESDGKPPLLCYVQHRRAWFTCLVNKSLRPFIACFGDGWGSAYYSKNSRPPFVVAQDDADGTLCRIVRVTFSSSFLSPETRHWQLHREPCPLSVHKINAWDAPWLTQFSPDGDDARATKIYAGCRIDAFCQAIQAAGGKITEMVEFVKAEPRERADWQRGTPLLKFNVNRAAVN